VLSTVYVVRVAQHNLQAGSKSGLMYAEKKLSFEWIYIILKIEMSIKFGSCTDSVAVVVHQLNITRFNVLNKRLQDYSTGAMHGSWDLILSVIPIVVVRRLRMLVLLVFGFFIFSQSWIFDVQTWKLQRIDFDRFDAEPQIFDSQFERMTSSLAIK